VEQNYIIYAAITPFKIIQSSIDFSDLPNQFRLVLAMSRYGRMFIKQLINQSVYLRHDGILYDYPLYGD